MTNTPTPTIRRTRATDSQGRTFEMVRIERTDFVMPSRPADRSRNRRRTPRSVSSKNYR